MRYATLLMLIAAPFCSPDARGAEFFGLDVTARRATDTSADGSVIVGVSQPENGSAQPFRWTQETGVVKLGLLPDANFAQRAIVSGDGKFVTGELTDPSFGVHRFEWQAETGILPSETPWLTDLSFDGTRGVGMSSRALQKAIRWTAPADTVLIDQRDLNAGASGAGAMTEDQSVIVGWAENLTSADSVEAFRWTPLDGMAGLGDLPGGRFFGLSHAVSADGRVVVGESSSAASGPDSVEAFRWTAETGMVPLGFQSNEPLLYSAAKDVSADGSVIVGATGMETQRAFIWDAQHGMRLLQDVLADEYGLGTQLAGWRLARADFISDDGRTIIGNGSRNGLGNAVWVAKIPEPPTIALAAFGMIALVTWQWRKQRNP